MSQMGLQSVVSCTNASPQEEEGVEEAKEAEEAEGVD